MNDARLNRLVILLALLGMLLTLHLWVQKERNFDHGCWGFGATVQTADTGGCNAPALQNVSQLLGLPLTVWSYGFYLAIGTLALAKLVASEPVAQRCQTLSEIAVGLAFPLCCYLVYFQFVIAKAYCPLCLISSGLVAGLFVIHAIQYKRGHPPPLGEESRKEEIGYASLMGFVAAGVLAGVMIMVDNVGSRRLDQGDYGKQFVAMLGKSLPVYIDAKQLREMRPAMFDAAKAKIVSEDWVSKDTPVLGGHDGAKVIVFLDPNCPHCKFSYALIRKLARESQGGAGFYVQPRVLWDYSLLQTQALGLATEEGKYFEMWQLQFDRQKNGGMGLEDIGALCDELGISRVNLPERLEAQRAKVVTSRDKAGAAGINSTPTIFIDGAAVAGVSMNEQGLKRLIADVVAAHRGR